MKRRAFLQYTAAGAASLVLRLERRSLAASSTPSDLFRSYSQRALGAFLLARDLPSALALDAAAMAKSGRDQAFMSAVSAFTSLSVDDKLAKLRAHVAGGVSADMRTLVGKRGLSLADIAGGLTAPAGLNLAISTIVGVSQVQSDLKSMTLTRVIGDLKQGVSVAPIFGAIADAGKAVDRLRDMAKGDGLLGLIASAGEKLAKGKGGAALGQAVALLEGQAAGFIKGLKNLKSLPSPAMLISAVQTVGGLLNVPKPTIDTITKVISTIGAVAQGAQMGASFGPIGAVVGGAVGLISSLFGGSGEPARDPTLEALTSINATLKQLHEDMVLGFTLLQKQIAEGFQAVTENLQQLRAEIAQLQLELGKEVNDLKRRIQSQARDQLIKDVNELVVLAEDHEEAFLRGLVERSNRRAEQTGPALKNQARRFVNLLSTPDQFFASAAIVGTTSLSSFVSKTLLEPCAIYTLDSLIPISSQYEGVAAEVHTSRPFNGPLLNGYEKLIYPGGPAPGLPKLSQGDDLLLEALRTDHYSAASDTVGPRTIHSLIQALVANVASFDRSPEFRRMTEAQREWIPTVGDLAGSYPVRPHDLQAATEAVATIAHSLRDPAVLRDVLDLVQPRLKAQCRLHGLLTDYSQGNVLLYLRRTIARDLCVKVAAVFSGRTMASAKIVRMVASSVRSQGQPPSADFAPMLATRAQALQLYRQQDMPLAAYQAGALPAAPPALANRIDELLDRFGGKQAGLTAKEAGALEIVVVNAREEFARLLVDEFKQKGLSRQLEEILEAGIALSLVEAVISLRLAAIANATGQAVAMRRYSDALGEYLLCAAQARGQAAYDKRGELAGANALVASHLGGLRQLDVRGALAKPAARPYPLEYGVMWGWGAEDLVFDTPAGDNLLRAIARPECALASANNDLLRVSAATAAMDSMLLEAKLFDAARPGLDAARIMGALRTAIVKEVKP